jgi:hypothetical protein
MRARQPLKAERLAITPFLGLRDNPNATLATFRMIAQPVLPRSRSRPMSCQDEAIMPALLKRRCATPVGSAYWAETMRRASSSEERSESVAAACSIRCFACERAFSMLFAFSAASVAPASAR